GRDGAREIAPVRTMAGDLGEFVEARQRRINRDVLAEALRKRRRDGLHSRIVWHKPAPPLDRGIPPQRAEPFKMAATSPARSIARQNHVLQNRINLVLPALAGKDAVVPDAGLHVVALEIR